MANLIKHKRVEFTELFYDLVFVYAISKTTGLIHHLHHGHLTWESMATFLMTLLVLVNNWMIQTVFTNRYGRNSLFNILVMFTNMAMLLLISNMITTDWTGYYHYFCWTVGTLTLTLFGQYLVEYRKKSSSEKDKQVIKPFLFMTGARTLAIYIAAMLPVNIGFPVFFLGVILTFVMPLIFTDEKTAFVPINLPHLIERISLLVIITFGEMIMGIAEFYTPEQFSIYSILYFVIMATLFLYYFGQFDHAMDEAADTQGLLLIYSHYPIFIGLLMTTVSMSFLVNPEANHLFVTLFYYIGLGLFQFAVLSNSKYNKDYLRFSKTYLLTEVAIYLSGLILSLIFHTNPLLVVVISMIMLLAIETHFTRFYMKASQAKNGFDWLWF